MRSDPGGGKPSAEWRAAIQEAVQVTGNEARKRSREVRRSLICCLIGFPGWLISAAAIAAWNATTQPYWLVRPVLGCLIPLFAALALVALLDLAGGAVPWLLARSRHRRAVAAQDGLEEPGTIPPMDVAEWRRIQIRRKMEAAYRKENRYFIAIGKWLAIGVMAATYGMFLRPNPGRWLSDSFHDWMTEPVLILLCLLSALSSVMLLVAPLMFAGMFIEWIKAVRERRKVMYPADDSDLY